jgi:hypothetical protein
MSAPDSLVGPRAPEGSTEIMHGGVAEWNGTTVTSCDFSGQYAIDRSFDASGDSDLNDLLAETYPGLRWSESDVWGYCDGTEPIVVIPMTRQIYVGNRTVVTAGGVVTVKGNYGQTQLSYTASVQPGVLPGPVYPASLVSTQLDQASWAGGRVVLSPKPRWPSSIYDLGTRRAYEFPVLMTVAVYLFTVTTIITTSYSMSKYECIKRKAVWVGRQASLPKGT